jgi:hypothetical protein
MTYETKVMYTKRADIFFKNFVRSGQKSVQVFMKSVQVFMKNVQVLKSVQVLIKAAIKTVHYTVKLKVLYTFL